MSERHLIFLRVAATAATFWLPFSANAQTLAAIAPLTLSPSPPTQMGAPSGSSGDAASFPDDPLKVAAEHVLETHCSRCHQADRLIGRSKPAKGFGNILDLDALATDPKYVRPGDADRSLLYHVIIRREMPSDVFQDGDLDHPVPDDKDMKALKAWISSLDPSAGVKVASLPNPNERLPVQPAMRDKGPLSPIRSEVTKSPTDETADAPAADLAPVKDTKSAKDVPVAVAPAVVAPAQPAAPIVVASAEVALAPPTAAADAVDDGTHELVTSAQQNLKRLGCYTGELTGVVDSSTTAAISHYNGIMGRGEQTSSVTSDMIEEMRSESGNICATRPILPAPTTASTEDDDQEKASARTTPTEKHEAKPAHHQPGEKKSRVATHEPTERDHKPAPQHRNAQQSPRREPTYRQAQRPSSSYRQAERGGGGGGGGGGGSSTVSGINGI